MALLNCPECNKEVSDKAGRCPNCGTKINTSNGKKTKVILGVIIAILLVGLILFLGIFIGMNLTQPVDDSNNSVVSEISESSEEESNKLHIGNREQPLAIGQSIDVSSYDYRIGGNYDMTINVKNVSSTKVDLDVTLNSSYKSSPVTFAMYEEDSWTFEYLYNPLFVYYTDNPMSWVEDGNTAYPIKDVTIGVGESKTISVSHNNEKYLIIRTAVLASDNPNAEDYDKIHYSGDGTKYLVYYYFLAVE